MNLVRFPKKYQAANYGVHRPQMLMCFFFFRMTSCVWWHHLLPISTDGHIPWDGRSFH